MEEAGSALDAERGCRLLRHNERVIWVWVSRGESCRPSGLMSGGGPPGCLPLRAGMRGVRRAPSMGLRLANRGGRRGLATSADLVGHRAPFVGRRCYFGFVPFGCIMGAHIKQMIGAVVLGLCALWLAANDTTALFDHLELPAPLPTDLELLRHLEPPIRCRGARLIRKGDRAPAPRYCHP